MTAFGLDGDGATEGLGDHHLFARSELHLLAAGNQRDIAVLSELDRCVSRCAHPRLLPGPRGTVTVEGASKCVSCERGARDTLGDSDIRERATSEPMITSWYLPARSLVTGVCPRPVAVRREPAGDQRFHVGAKRLGLDEIQ